MDTSNLSFITIDKARRILAAYHETIEAAILAAKDDPAMLASIEAGLAGGYGLVSVMTKPDGISAEKSMAWAAKATNRLKAAVGGDPNSAFVAVCALAGILSVPAFNQQREAVMATLTQPFPGGNLGNDN